MVEWREKWRLSKRTREHSSVYKRGLGYHCCHDNDGVDDDSDEADYDDHDDYDDDADDRRIKDKKALSARGEGKQQYAQWAL